MKRTLLFATTAGLSVSSVLFSLTQAPSVTDAVRKITLAVTSSTATYDNLKELCSGGPRLVGTEGETKSVAWAKAKLESLGLDRVWLQPVDAPRWSRGGKEKVVARSSEGDVELAAVALGGTVGTGGKPLEAGVIEVKSLDEVEKLGDAVRGKIVFYNRAMDPNLPNTFEAYGKAVDQRSAGASQAARFGGVGVLVRTMTTLPDDEHPHTGVMSYQSGVPKVPALAISTRAANRLSALIKKSAVKIRLELDSRPLASGTSYNVIGELRGREKPEEIVLIGGHLDSWDLGPAAHDNGAGVVHSIEVLRAMKATGLRPKRTLRVVLFAAEESGGWGGQEYVKQAASEKATHLAAIESDRGGFAPTAFTVDAPAPIHKLVQSWAPHFTAIAPITFRSGYSGTDTMPLKNIGTATFGLLPDSKRYFDVHHAATDQLSAVKPAELRDGAAAIAVFAYLIAESGLTRSAP